MLIISGISIYYCTKFVLFRQLDENEYNWFMDNLRSLTLFICLVFLLSVVGMMISTGAGEKRNWYGHFSFAPHIYIGLVRFIYLYIEPNLFLTNLLTCNAITLYQLILQTKNRVIKHSGLKVSFYLKKSEMSDDGLCRMTVCVRWWGV